MTTHAFADLIHSGVRMLAEQDPTLSELIEREYQRQTDVLTMVAASSVVDPSVLVCEASVPVNVTAEGYPGARFHAGCAVIDEIESLAIERAKTAFGARYANVQSHSATTANQLVMCSLLRPGDKLLGLELNSGGHLTHGSGVSLSGQYFQAIGYGLTEDGSLDYDQIRALAVKHRPRLIICGTTAYPRVIDFERFRQIADEVGAYLLADVTHIAGLVVAGLHPSPIDHAHFTTTCTHKQLYGPRGGLILMGRDHDQPVEGSKWNLSELVQRAVFPFFQGAPKLNSITAKARAFDRIVKPEFTEVMHRIVDDADALAKSLISRGYTLVTGGTNNHLVIVDVTPHGITGVIAEAVLEENGIIVNKNRIPGDTRPATITSGIRIGTNSLAARRMGPDVMPQCADLVDRVLTSVTALNDRDYSFDESLRQTILAEVRQICDRFPIPNYPLSVTQANAAATRREASQRAAGG